MSKAALVIMAAGMGSRYGGVKQIAGVGPRGEILMEYAVYDALRAGFDKVVFIVTAELEAGIREKFGPVLARRGAEMAVAVQSWNTLPAWFSPAPARTKPYGTGHAVLCTRELIREPFAVINADDYYGADGFQTMFDRLMGLQPGEAAMVGYRLKNTVSKNGTVTRGVCTARDGALETVTETYKIALFPDGTIRDTAQDEAGVLLDPEAVVSMNFWGFHPSVFEALENYLTDFLRGLPADDLKQECLLPGLVDSRIRAGALRVDVLHTDARWFGMTYAADHETVRQEIAALHTRGVYPEQLW